MNKIKFMTLSSILGAGLLAVSSAGSLSLQSDSQEIIRGCPTNINILIDTENEEVGTASARIVLNSSFVVNKFDSSNGVFRTYLPPKKLTATQNEFAGKEVIKFLGTTSSPNGFKGQGNFGSFTITANDDVNLEFYMVPNYGGDDSNMFILNENNTSEEVLSSVNNLSLRVVDGDCPVESLGEISLSDIQPTVISEDVETIVENVIEINEENVFDKSQESNLFKKYRLYGLILIAIAGLSFVLYSTKKKK